MNIEKIIKMYFLAVMLMVSMAALSYNANVKNFMASVFFVDAKAYDQNLANYSGNSRLPKISYNPEFMANNALRSFKFPVKREKETYVTFEITDNGKMVYASPGETEVNFMNFSISLNDEEVAFDYINFRIKGVQSEMIERAYIKEGESVFEGVKDGDYLKFTGMNIVVLPGEEKILQVYVDLSEKLQTSDRFRLDIEKSEDLGIFVDEERYLPFKNYPVKGKYLTIARRRPLFVESESLKAEKK